MKNDELFIKNDGMFIRMRASVDSTVAAWQTTVQCSIDFSLTFHWFSVGFVNVWQYLLMFRVDFSWF